MKGYIYLVKRDKTGIKILHEVDISEKMSNPNPYELIKDQVIATSVAETIKENRMRWEAYAEPGNINEIIERLKKTGVKIIVGKHHPVVKKTHGNNPISFKHVGRPLPKHRP